MKHRLVVFALLVLIPSLATAQETLFFDDFTGSYDDAWTNPDGEYFVQDGRLVVPTSCGFAQCNPNIYGGGDFHNSYIVSFDFLVTEAFTTHGAYVRSLINLDTPIEPHEGTLHGYALGCGWSEDGDPANANCEIKRWDGDSYVLIAYDSGPEYWIEPNVVYHMKAGRLGTQVVFKKWAQGDPEPGWQLSVADDNYLSGYWMPTFWNNVGWIDNYKVEGYGVVRTEEASWGSLKALYR